MTTTAATGAVAAEAATTMTDRRWDTLPVDPSTAPTAKLPAVDRTTAPTGPDAGRRGAERPTRRRRDAPAAAAPRPARPKISKPGPFPVIAGSLGLFFAIVALLAFQLRAGKDPAIGAGEPQLVAQASSRGRARSSSGG